MKFSVIFLGLCAVLVIFTLIVAPIPAWAKSPVNKNWTGLAIKGYDPVAYFTLGKPVAGKKEFEYKRQDAKWRFANEDHLNLFKSDPEKYAPQYGGY
jgi:YHS domain-containing protein